MQRPKVLVFLTFDYPAATGTTLWAKNFLENIDRVPNIEFILVFSGSTRNQSFVNEVLAREYVFVPFLERLDVDAEDGGDRRRKTIRNIIDAFMEKYLFWNEAFWREQAHVDAALKTIVCEKKPDLIILGGMSAALGAPSIFSLSVPCCLVTLNNEISVYREVKSKGGRAGMGTLELWFYRHFNWVANRRIANKVNRVYRQCFGIVALTQGDLPRTLADHVIRAVIPPVLEKSSSRWRYHETRRVLFVGNILAGAVMHYPNRLAIEWICSRLAPEFRRIDDRVTINIIGATESQVPAAWRYMNVTFMGRADERELVSQMTTADLFVAPIENSYGAKLKLAECVSYRAPFVATEGAMSGLPFLDMIPRIDLRRPDIAAELMVGLMNNPEKLKEMSEQIDVRAQRARVTQDIAWETFFANALAKLSDVSRP